MSSLIPTWVPFSGRIQIDDKVHIFGQSNRRHRPTSSHHDEPIFSIPSESFGSFVDGHGHESLGSHPIGGGDTLGEHAFSIGRDPVSGTEALAIMNALSDHENLLIHGRPFRHPMENEIIIGHEKVQEFFPHVKGSGFNNQPSYQAAPLKKDEIDRYASIYKFDWKPFEKNQKEQKEQQLTNRMLTGGHMVTDATLIDNGVTSMTDNTQLLSSRSLETIGPVETIDPLDHETEATIVVANERGKNLPRPPQRASIPTTRATTTLSPIPVTTMMMRVREKVLTTKKPFVLNGQEAAETTTTTSFTDVNDVRDVRNVGELSNIPEDGFSDGDDIFIESTTSRGSFSDFSKRTSTLVEEITTTMPPETTTIIDDNEALPRRNLIPPPTRSPVPVESVHQLIRATRRRPIGLFRNRLIEKRAGIMRTSRLDKSFLQKGRKKNGSVSRVHVIQ